MAPFTSTTHISISTSGHVIILGILRCTALSKWPLGYPLSLPALVLTRPSLGIESISTANIQRGWCALDVARTSSLSEEEHVIHLCAQVCMEKNEPLWEEIDIDQEMRIRTRPKRDYRTIGQKWVDMYKIIFPDEPYDDIPVPDKSLAALLVRP